LNINHLLLCGTVYVIVLIRIVEG